jgi:hypothetical protein
LIQPARRRSAERAARAQDVFDRLIVVAAGLAITGVALQLVKAEPLHAIGLVVAGLSWLIFAADAAVMLSVSPDAAAWARGHRLDLALLAVTFPLWPVLLHDLLLLELTPALTLFEAAKLAKLAKAAGAVHIRARDRMVAVVVLGAAVGVGALVVFG